MKWLQENWFKLAILVTILIISGAGLYWLAVKPNLEKKWCYKLAYKQRQMAIQLDNNVEGKGMLIKRADYNKVFDNAYDDCLKETGLN